jgi:hypothetical protein
MKITTGRKKKKVRVELSVDEFLQITNRQTDARHTCCRQGIVSAPVLQEDADADEEDEDDPAEQAADRDRQYRRILDGVKRRFNVAEKRKSAAQTILYIKELDTAFKDYCRKLAPKK